MITVARGCARDRAGESPRGRAPSPKRVAPVRNESGARDAEHSEMVGNQHETLDDVTAERLLDGTDGRPSALARLLARAAGPATAAELNGEAAALAAFRSARLSPTRSRRRWLVAVAALVFTFASTGVAVA